MACGQSSVGLSEIEDNKHNRNRSHKCLDCECCPHCTSWTIDCPECCQCLARSLCFRFIPDDEYKDIIQWSMDYVKGGSYGSIGLFCDLDGVGPEDVIPMSVAIENPYGTCQWRFTIGGIDHIYTSEEIGCLFDFLSFDVDIGYCSGVLEVKPLDRIVMPIEQRGKSKCWRNWCDIAAAYDDTCPCLCTEICVYAHDGSSGCFSIEEDVSTVQSESPPWVWTGTLRCQDFQVVEGEFEEYPFTFTIDRNEDFECIARLEIADQTVEQPLTGDCTKLELVFSVLLNPYHYEESKVVVQCAKCSQCLGPDSCCFRVLPRTLHMTYESAKEFGTDGPDAYGVVYELELNYQPGFDYWLGFIEDGMGESSINEEQYTHRRYHIRFEFQCDLGAENVPTLTVFGAPAFSTTFDSKVTPVEIPMPDPFDLDANWAVSDSGNCGIAADSGFRPRSPGGSPRNYESLMVCDPFIWYFAVPEEFRGEGDPPVIWGGNGTGEALGCTSVRALFPDSGNPNGTIDIELGFFWWILITE